jgi:hypothetical protein
MPCTAEEKQRLQGIARDLRLTIVDVMAWSGGAHVGGETFYHKLGWKVLERPLYHSYQVSVMHKEIVKVAD